MNKKKLLKGLFLSIGIICLQSCDKDFNTIGNGVIGEPGFDIETYTVSDITAYNQAMGNGSIPAGVETGNLSEISLGSYQDPVFGRTTASFVTAVNLPADFPSTFGNNIKVDSVYVYIPYFGELDRNTENNEYKLDKITGSGDFDLKIYENGYFLYESNIGGANDLNRYYSNDNNLIDNSKKTTVLNDTPNSKQNTNFFFDNKEIIIYKRDKEGNILKEGEGENMKDAIKERLAAGLWVDLNTDYFQNLIFENRDQFNDASTFNNYFKGLFFSATPNASSTGALGKLNFTNARLVVNYSQDIENEGENTREHKTITFGISLELPNINFFDNDYSGDYMQALQNQDKVDGDEKLYIKGGNGSVAIIDIFNKNNQDELKRLKDDDILINDAILTIYIDKEAMKFSEYEPERLYLYNIDENLILADYNNDLSKENSSFFKPSFGGFLEKGKTEEDNKGIRYRFKITDHIRNIIKKENTFSPKLGLIAVEQYTNSNNIVANKALKEAINNTPTPIKTIPAIGVLQPLGTILYGTNNSDEVKKMKLEIFYTKTKK